MWTISRALALSTCSPGRGEDCSADYFSDGEPSAPSKSTSSAGRCSSPGRTTGPWRLSRFGTTYGVLTGSRGEEIAKSLLAAFHARTSRRSGTGPASGGASPASGASSPASQGKCSPSGSSPKTRPTSSSSGSTSSYRTLTRSGTMRNGNVSPRPSSEPPMSGTGYGFLPRRGAADYQATLRRLQETVSRLKAGEDVALPRKEFAFWPTPTRSDAKNNGVPSQLLRQYVPLSCRVRITPDGGFDRSGGRANPEFVEWLMGWPMGWSALDPLATDRFLSWRLPPSWTSAGGSGRGPETKGGET